MIQKFIKYVALHVFQPFSDLLYKHIIGYMQRSGFMLCAAHTSVASHTDATYAISASLPATYDAAGYAATTITYTAIGKVIKFPAFGSNRPTQEIPLINAAVEYIKGSARYGGGDFTMGDVPADAGQVILKAAEASANHYSIKITYSDSEVHYLDVLVNKWELSEASENTPMIRTAGLQLCKTPVVVAAS